MQGIEGTGSRLPDVLKRRFGHDALLPMEEETTKNVPSGPPRAARSWEKVLITKGTEAPNAEPQKQTGPDTQL